MLTGQGFGVGTSVMNVGEFRAARKKEILRPQSHNLIFLPCFAMGHIVQQQQSQNKHGNKAKEGEKEGELVFPLGDIDWGCLPIGRLRRQLLGRKKKSRHLCFPILLLYGAGYDGNRERKQIPWIRFTATILARSSSRYI